MPLIGFVYRQNADPGAVGFPYWWVKDNGDAYSRDTTNTSWIFQGNWDDPHSGCLPLTGGVMTGPIMTTGVSSWAPLDSPDFTGTPQKQGIALATTTELANAIASLQSLINTQVTAAISGTSAAITIGNNLAFDSGTVLHGGTIPLPQYSNGDDATQGEIAAMIVSINSLTHVYYDGISYDALVTCSVNPSTRVVTCTWDKSGDIRTGTANYLIICTR